MEFIRQIVTTDKHDDFKTSVLVASVRHPRQLVEATLASGHSCMMPASMFQQLVQHPLTDLGKSFSRTGTLNPRSNRQLAMDVRTRPCKQRSMGTFPSR
jgi:transaldolase